MCSWHEGFAPPTPRSSSTEAWVLADLRDRQADPAPESAEERREVELMHAYEEGLGAGREQGARLERERLQTCLRALEEAVEEFSRSSADWTDALEENVAALAVATARFVVDRELSTDPETILRIVTRALAEFSVDEPVQVRINPNDLAILHALDASEGAPRMASFGRCRWMADGQILPGGCIVAGRERIVDGRVDSALERVYRRLVHQHA